ncbi:hypothetical protein [Clostridium botulinum]|uniref:Uncharacterized protein n=1 Tax=Clostridium botulinum TaxID=1491 RepID=A0A9Q1ZBV1_CLOBO|nr:hypothetical protein [Clostridium botulinum]AEB77461.1 hypothetical protein CbC4_5040 [Clostridium botulinum BKT015925]KEH96053.1 hypothetical protein Y848_p0039 [Clostridium botulinum C/D str. Sp77]KEH96960.1 hypothetical protein Z953_13230 [Clostridium botulinum D str. 16868]KLU74627.1 hypothetical protein CBC3_13095 [Clostridium botulinum V891]KOA74155.1 hypothetical protein ADU77_12535 [Clostridium botulinum]
MNTIRFLGMSLNVDVEKTKDYYNNLSIKDQCMCDYCKNYRKVAQSFPKKVLSIFDMFGIDYMKADEISECGGNIKNQLYMCSYYFCGEIIARENNLIKDRYINIGNFRFNLNKDVYVDLKEVPPHVLQLQVWANLPWIL